MARRQTGVATRNERPTVKLTGLLLLLAVALLNGCVTRSPDVATYYHPGDGLRTDVITDNPLDTGEPGRELLWLNASRVFKTETRYDYYLEVTYAAKAETGYLDIGPGPTLSIEADGKEMIFIGNGSENLRKNKKGVLNETALYLAQANDLRAIASAKKVSVRVVGRHGIVQRDFGPANSERFKKFVAKFVPPPR
jgi:hypothetical protein